MFRANHDSCLPSMAIQKLTARHTLFALSNFATKQLFMHSINTPRISSCLCTTAHLSSLSLSLSLSLLSVFSVFLVLSEMGAATCIDIILAIILPPLGVFLKYGCEVQFWICLILTILGYLPGILYALYVITK